MHSNIVTGILLHQFLFCTLLADFTFVPVGLAAPATVLAPPFPMADMGLAAPAPALAPPFPMADILAAPAPALAPPFVVTRRESS